MRIRLALMFFFFNDTATTEIYTLSLHDALPICAARGGPAGPRTGPAGQAPLPAGRGRGRPGRSEEHTSELQSRLHLVCRLLLEKKKKHGSVDLLRHFIATTALQRCPHTTAHLHR